METLKLEHFFLLLLLLLLLHKHYTPGQKSISLALPRMIPSSGNKEPYKPVSFSQLGEERRSGDKERRQHLLESAWKLLICERPAGLIQPLHECVCFHTGLLNSFISRHRTTTDVDKYTQRNAHMIIHHDRTFTHFHKYWIKTFISNNFLF